MNNGKQQYRVVVIDPSTIVRQGLNQIIDQHPDFNIVGMLDDLNRAEERVMSLRADIVIVNPTLADFHKRNSIRGMFPNRVVVALIYNYVEGDTLRQFQGHIELYDNAIEITNKLTEIVMTSGEIDTSTTLHSDMSELSDREKEILIAVAKGLMNKEIAALHNISIHTVISHRKNISRKTGIKSASGLTVYAMLNNLIEQNDIQTINLTTTFTK